MHEYKPKNSIDYGKIAGFVVLAAVWVWLSVMIFTQGAFNLRNILIVVFSGIIIFVPLWKKYIRPMLNSRADSQNKP